MYTLIYIPTLSSYIYFYSLMHFYSYLHIPINVFMNLLSIYLPMYLYLAFYKSTSI